MFLWQYSNYVSNNLIGYITIGSNSICSNNNYINLTGSHHMPSIVFLRAMVWGRPQVNSRTEAQITIKYCSGLGQTIEFNLKTSQ